MADDETESNLQRLRAKYAGLSGGHVFDPHFKDIASKTISADGRRKLPYSDPATFLDAAYRQNAFASPEGFVDLDVALIGVPMDLGVTNRSGCRLGPRAVRAVERIGPYEHVLRVAPQGVLSVADVGDVPLRSRYSLESCHEDIETALRSVVQAGVIPLSVGGDHSMTQAILRAVGESSAGRAHPYRCACGYGGLLRGVALSPWRPVPPCSAGWCGRPRADAADRHPRHGGVSLRVLDR